MSKAPAPLKRRTVDYAGSHGRRVAYQVIGDGPSTLVFVAHISHLDLVWDEPWRARFLRHLGEHTRLVLFDRRGVGLSDPLPGGRASPADAVNDIQTVMDTVGVVNAAIFGCGTGGPLAIQFAATCPTRVSSLILYGTYATMLAKPDYPWGLSSERFAELAATFGSIALRSPSVASSRALQNWTIQFVRSAASPSGMQDAIRLAIEHDVRPVLEHVSAPTLVLGRRDDVLIPHENSKYLASHLPFAHLVQLEGVDHDPWFGDTGAVLEPIEDFLVGESRGKDRRPGPPNDLSLREHQVISLLAVGCTAQEVGRRLMISKRTAETHIGRIYRKLGVNTRTELLRRVFEDETPEPSEASRESFDRTQDALSQQGLSASPSDVKYAAGPNGLVAYQVFGEGPTNAVVMLGAFSHIYLMWDEPSIALFLKQLGAFCRVILFDRRGIGLSDPVAGPMPTADDVAQDVESVMDDADIDQATVMGFSWSGSLAASVAAALPDRVNRLVLYGTFAKLLAAPGYPHGLTRQEFASIFASQSAPVFAEKVVELDWSSNPTMALDRRKQQWIERFVRSSASPEVMDNEFRMYEALDIRERLSEIRVPTLVIARTDDPFVSVENSRYLASHIPEASLLELPGYDHSPWIGDSRSVITSIARFLANDGLSARRPAHHLGLTRRESEIVELVYHGLTAAQVARRLGISQRTAEHHMANIYTKWGIRSRADLLRRFSSVAEVAPEAIFGPLPRGGSREGEMPQDRAPKLRAVSDPVEGESANPLTGA